MSNSDPNNPKESGTTKSPQASPGLQLLCSDRAPFWIKIAVWLLPFWWLALVVSVLVAYDAITKIFGMQNLLVYFEHEVIYVCFLSPYVMLALLTVKCKWLSVIKSIAIGVLWYFGMSWLFDTLAPMVIQVGPGNIDYQDSQTLKQQ